MGKIDFPISLSIIIPNKDRFEDLIKCLKSIKKQTFKDYEILIVDDCSKNKTVYENKIFIESGAKLIKNKSAKGAAASKNIGAKAAVGNLLMFLDSDSELLNEHVLENVVSIMRDNPTIGAIGGELHIGKAKEYLLPLRVISLKTGIIFRMFKEWGNVHQECEFISSCNCTVRKDIFITLNGFEEKFNTYFEDADFCFRIRKLGYKVITCSKTLVIHHISKEGRGSFKVNYLNSRNRILFVLLHGKLKYFFLLPLFEARELMIKCISLIWFVIGYFWNIVHLPFLLKLKKESYENSRKQH